MWDIQGDGGGAHFRWCLLLRLAGPSRLNLYPARTYSRTRTASASHILRFPFIEKRGYCNYRLVSSPTSVDVKTENFALDKRHTLSLSPFPSLYSTKKNSLHQRSPLPSMDRQTRFGLIDHHEVPDARKERDQDQHHDGGIYREVERRCGGAVRFVAFGPPFQPYA